MDSPPPVKRTKITKSCLKEEESINVLQKSSLKMKINNKPVCLNQVQDTYIKNVDMLPQCIMPGQVVDKTIILFFNNFINILNLDTKEQEKYVFKINQATPIDYLINRSSNTSWFTETVQNVRFINKRNKYVYIKQKVLVLAEKDGKYYICMKNMITESLEEEDIMFPYQSLMIKRLMNYQI